jgi:hypothetical protein
MKGLDAAFAGKSTFNENRMKALQTMGFVKIPVTILYSCSALRMTSVSYSGAGRSWKNRLYFKELQRLSLRGLQRRAERSEAPGRTSL